MKNAARRCVYCGVSIDQNSREHVPPKLFLEKHYPDNLRVVPSCSVCNNGWSADEEYLINFLAQITNHEGLQKRIELGGRVDRALSACPPKDDELIDSLEVAEDGRVSIEADIDRIGRVTSKLAFGLYCLKYGVGKSSADFSTVWVSGFDHQVPSPLRASQWGAFSSRRKVWKTVQDRVFSFLFAEGSMAGDPPSYCFLNFYDTLFVAVSGPHLVGGPKMNRLRSRPW
jgi:hypothetical protein